MQETLEKGEQDLFNRQMKQMLPTKYINDGADFHLSNNAVAALVLKKLVQMDYRFDVHDQLGTFNVKLPRRITFSGSLKISKTRKWQTL